jgi:RHS repeat-associated protein
VQITRYTYDGASHVLTLTADMPAGTADQVTQYVYNMTQAGVSNAALVSNDLLWQVRYPDPTTGQPGTASDAMETYTYDATGAVLTKTGRDGNSHTYRYDALGRQISDSAAVKPTVPVNNGTPLIPDGDFEDNALQPQDWVYNPTDNHWSFAGDAGLYRSTMYEDFNTNAFVESNRPDGTNGAISQTFTVPAGTYGVRFYCTVTDAVSVQFDNQTPLTVTTGSTVYVHGDYYYVLTTNTGTLTAGTHTLTVYGSADSSAGDVQACIDNLQLFQVLPTAINLEQGGQTTIALAPGNYLLQGSLVAGSSRVTLSLGDTVISDSDVQEYSEVPYASDTFTVTVAGTYTLSVSEQISFTNLQLCAVDSIGTIIAAQRIDTTYNALGQIETVTSLDLADSGNVLNQIRRQYNGLGQLTREYQAHDGAVDINSTLYTGYAYDTAAHGSRLASMTYPDTTSIVYNYTNGGVGSLNNVISRLDRLIQGGATLESYTYLGLSTVVERSQGCGLKLTYIAQGTGDLTGDSQDPYVGLDRFGRVVDQRWYNLSNHTSPDRYQYTYDRDANVTDKVNASYVPVPDVLNLNEHYVYDGLNRLTGVTGLDDAARSQSFALDALGNLTSVTGSSGTDTRVSNSRNELVSLNGHTLTYDANGNLTADDQGRLYVYDAWNRLLAVENSDTSLLAAYAYDGLGRRIEESTPDGNGGLTTTDLYFSAAWQVLEEYQAGLPTQRHVYSPVYVNALLARDDDANHDGTPERRLYVTQDANFNSTTLLDAAGNIQEHFVYSAYGVKTITNSLWVVQSGDPLHLNLRNTFQGGREDLTTGLINFQRRDYNPRTYTWNTADPIQDGLNWYEPFGGNPINHVDPQGTWKFVPNAGVLTGRLGPKSGARLSPALFELSFHPNPAVFGEGAGCSEIDFIQICYADTNISSFRKWVGELAGGIPQNRWFEDSTPDNRPYYNYKSDAIDPTKAGLTLVMDDSPGDDKAPFRIPEQSRKFETAVVAAKGPNRGDVYAVITWGFSYRFELGPIWNIPVVPSYYVNDVQWSPDSPLITWVQANNDQDGSPLFDANGKPDMIKLGSRTGNNTYYFSFATFTPPSPEMTGVLNKYFPYGFILN